MGSIFTSFHPTMIGRNSGWYTIRPITEADFTTTGWHVSEPLTEKSKEFGSFENPFAHIAFKPKNETFDLLPEMKAEVAEMFVATFYNEVVWVRIEVPVSYVGIRKNVQWAKFNEAREKLLAIYNNPEEREKRVREAFDAMNKRMELFAQRARDNYIHDAVSHYSQIGSYDLKVLDSVAANGEINAEIAKAEAAIRELRAKRLENRQAALNSYWVGENDFSLPKEAVEAVRTHVKENGFKPIAYLFRHSE
jgi:hypothetical protein